MANKKMKKNLLKEQKYLSKEQQEKEDKILFLKAIYGDKKIK